MSNAFKTNPRRVLTDQKKAKLFAERGGYCHRCKRKLRPGDIWTVEHFLALENGGTNDWDNLTITCAWCKPGKDKDDHGKAAKSRSVATSTTVPEREKKKSRLSAKPEPPPGYVYNSWTRRYEPIE